MQKRAITKSIEPDEYIYGYYVKIENVAVDRPFAKLHSSDHPASRYHIYFSYVNRGCASLDAAHLYFNNNLCLVM